MRVLRKSLSGQFVSHLCWWCRLLGKGESWGSPRVMLKGEVATADKTGPTYLLSLLSFLCPNGSVSLAFGWRNFNSTDFQKWKKKERFDRPDGGELNQVQVVTINSSFSSPPLNSITTFISPKFKQLVDIKAGWRSLWVWLELSYMASRSEGGACCRYSGLCLMAKGLRHVLGSPMGPAVWQHPCVFLEASTGKRRVCRARRSPEGVMLCSCFATSLLQSACVSGEQLFWIQPWLLRNGGSSSKTHWLAHADYSITHLAMVGVGRLAPECVSLPAVASNWQLLLPAGPFPSLCLARLLVLRARPQPCAVPRCRELAGLLCEHGEEGSAMLFL